MPPSSDAAGCGVTAPTTAPTSRWASGCTDDQVRYLSRSSSKPPSYLIPGGPLLPLYDALAKDSNIRLVLVKHEQAAAYDAFTYARVTGDLRRVSQDEWIDFGAVLNQPQTSTERALQAMVAAKLDSFDVVTLILEIEQRFPPVTLSDKSAERLRTLREVAAHIDVEMKRV